MLCCPELLLAPCMLNKSLKPFWQKLLPKPISSTIKENAQPGFELAPTELPILVQHLTTKPTCTLLTRIQPIKVERKAHFICGEMALFSEVFSTTTTMTTNTTFKDRLNNNNNNDKQVESSILLLKQR